MDILCYVVYNAGMIREGKITSTFQKNPRKRSIAEKATSWVGSVESLVVHTILFIVAFLFVLFGVDLDTVLLILTTVVSLEAIYLAIFIQMSVNRQATSLEGVEDDIDELHANVKEIGDDVDELSEDVDEIAKDIDEISEDVDEIAKDVDDLSEDVDEIAKDIDEIGEDIDEIGEDIDDIQEHDEKHEKPSLDKIEEMLKRAIEDLERLKSPK